MHLLLEVIVFLLAFGYHEHEATATQAIVAPLTKHVDTDTPLYSVDIMTRFIYPNYVHTRFLIDIEAPLTWYDCILQWNIYPGSCPDNMICNYPVSCQEYQCADVRSSYSYQSPSCPPLSDQETLPGWGDCTCPVNVVNPVTGSCGHASLDYDDFTVNTSDGRNPFNGQYAGYANAGCAPSSVFESFPANVRGVMALSSSPYAFPAYLFDPLKKIIALCLPSSSSAPGMMFVGSGPYYLLPQSDVDVRSLLSYTPLLKYPNSFGYFIGVKAILVNGKPIHLLLHDNTTKLSTVTRYTTLRTDVYNSLIDSFSKAANRIPHVDPIKPFGLCFNTTSVGHTRVGLRVPHISFYLLNGTKWTIFGANSMQQMSKDVACLAFVDGGLSPEHAIVIGTQQIEDNFLMVDLGNSTLGFSSSLLYKKTSCSNFNFTIGNENP